MSRTFRISDRGVRAAELHVVGRVVADAGEFVFRQFASHLCWDSRDEGARRDDGALKHDSARRHERASPDDRAIEHRCVHADEAVILNRAAMNDRAVADAHARADRRRNPRVAMHDNIVLQVTACAERDLVGVAAQHRPVEHARIRAKRYATDERRVRRDPGGVVDGGGMAVEGSDEGSRHVLKVTPIAGSPAKRQRAVGQVTCVPS